MNDVELDDRIGAGLRALIDRAGPPLPYPGDSDDRVPAPGSRDRRRPRVMWVLGAAAVVVALVTGIALSTGPSKSSHDVDAVGATRGDGLHTWVPGWHDLATSGVSDLNSVSVVFLHGDLYLAGTRYPRGADRPHTELRRFDPVTKGWLEVPAPDMLTTTIVAAGEQLVAVGANQAASGTDLADPGEWATWRPGDASWRGLGGIAAAPPLQRLDGAPMRTRHLVWTGRRVIDLTQGSVLDPTAGTTTPLELPSDIGSTALVESTTPVWTGSLVVMTAWSARSGVAWDVDGRLVGLLPPPPDVPTIGDSTPAAATGGAVVVLAVRDDSGTTLAARLDPTAGTWTRLDDLPPTPIPTGTRCSYVVAGVDDRVVAAPCAANSSGAAGTFTLDDDRWRPIASTRPGPECCPVTATGGGTAAAISTTDASAAVRIAVWIPNR